MSKVDVLVVDDDEAIAEFVAVILAERGYQVRTACNGRQALDLLRETPPQVLLLDLMLPLMDGWDLAQTMRESPTLKDVPVVVMSAHNDVPEEAQAVGAVAYLHKPFDLDELFSCVATYAGARR